jgi:hypothetical protein
LAFPGFLSVSSLSIRLVQKNPVRPAGVSVYGSGTANITAIIVFAPVRTSQRQRGRYWPKKFEAGADCPRELLLRIADKGDFFRQD